MVIHDKQRHVPDPMAKPDASRSARFGTDSVTPEGDKQTSSEAKHRVERPRILETFGVQDWIVPSQSIPGN